MLKNYTFLSLFAFIITLTSCTSESNSDERNAPDKSANYKSLGASANDLLSDVKYQSLYVEIVYVEGYQPTTEALAALKSFIEQRTFKPDGITFSLRTINSSGKAPFSLNEIDQLERENRSVFNTGDELAVYIYYADGSNENDDDKKVVVGSAYWNTSIVIYGETINSLNAKTNIPKSDIEAMTLKHEFGHLFGLVDLGTEPQSDHVDEENEGHCNVDGCLMRANLEFGPSLIEILEEGKMIELGEQCILDLQANGGR